jgi:hypothetical protein
MAWIAAGGALGPLALETFGAAGERTGAHPSGAHQQPCDVAGEDRGAPLAG